MAHHRWAEIKLRRRSSVWCTSRSKHDSLECHPWWTRQISKRRHCIKCGMLQFVIYMDFRKYWTLITPWGNTTRKITQMPPCLGLPRGYDAPIGA